MTIDSFKEKLSTEPTTVAFTDTMEIIEEVYDFTPTAFKNGDTFNESNQNNGSCKLFAFAQLQQLTKDETLACFGTYYRNDVLGNPDGDDHQNIRNFMTHGWEGISFEGEALMKK